MCVLLLEIHFVWFYSEIFLRLQATNYYLSEEQNVANINFIKFFSLDNDT